MPQTFLLTNPSFEDATLFWGTEEYDPKGHLVGEVVTDWSYDGSKSYKISANASPTGVTDGSYFLIKQAINVNGSGHEEIAMRLKYDTGTYFNVIVRYKKFTGDTWTTLLTIGASQQGETSHTIKIPNEFMVDGSGNQLSGELQIMLFATGGTTGNFTGGVYVYIDNLFEQHSTESGEFQLSEGQLYYSGCAGDGADNTYICRFKVDKINEDNVGWNWIIVDIWAPWQKVAGSGSCSSTYNDPPVGDNITLYINDEVTYSNGNETIALKLLSVSSHLFRVTHWKKYANTRFVDLTTGSDSAVDHEGNCWSAAFATIGKGFGEITSGGELYIKFGDYSSETITWNKSVTIRPSIYGGGKLSNPTDLGAGTLTMPKS